MRLRLLRLEDLGSADPGGPRLFAGFAGRFRLGRFRLGRFRLAVSPVSSRPFVSAGFVSAGFASPSPSATMASASASRAPPFRSHGARLLGGRELFSGPWFSWSHASLRSASNRDDRPQRLRLQGVEVGVVDLVEAMGVQVHGGRSGSRTIVFHSYPMRGSQSLQGGGLNGYFHVSKYSAPFTTAIATW